MVKTLLLVVRTIFQRKSYLNIKMIVRGLPRVLVLHNLQIASWTNHRKAAKDIHNGDMFFLATDNDLLRQIAAPSFENRARSDLRAVGAI